MYVLIMNLLLEEKTLTSHSFERYCIFYGSLMNLFQKDIHVGINPETGSVYNHDLYIKKL